MLVTVDVQTATITLHDYELQLAPCFRAVWLITLKIRRLLAIQRLLRLHLLCPSHSHHLTCTVIAKHLPHSKALPAELEGCSLQVEWTRELHDKFVSAVEALSVDKAVPSKILERMGTCSEGLTRQNIASHLQKYRNR